MKHQLITDKKGFTLIETLVAVAILMIAIAGPLTIANKALTSALYARDQSIASNLAQESMEIIKNMRDNNIASGNDFTTGLTGSPDCTKSTRDVCDAGMSSGVGVTSPFPTCPISPASPGCQIYLSDSNGYTNDGTSDTPTIFHRHFYLTAISSDLDDYKVTVIVDWKEGTVPNQLTLNSELVNATR